MFHSARIKLTAWYLLIIVTISASFSAFIYIGVSKEIERGFQRAGIRYLADQMEMNLPKSFPKRLEDIDPQIREALPSILFPDDLNDAKHRLALFLVYINTIIVGVSGVAGYFLAGKTLSPIEVAMDEQKRFVADASHELRTPLTAMKTSMEVTLRDKKLKLSEAKKIIKDSIQDVDSLEALASNLLTLANYQSVGNGFIFEKSNLKEIIDLAITKLQPLVNNKKIKLQVKSESITIVADKVNLGKLFTILIENAIKYTPENGCVSVEAKKSGRSVVVKVSDTGMGIGKKDVSHIFERFYRAEDSRTKIAVDGFGLGLSVAQEIVDKHKGSIKVDSKLGKGSTFIVKLPVHS